MRPPMLLAMLALAIAPALAAQQGLAARVARSADGTVHVRYAARAGVCGDGRDVVGYKRALFARSFRSVGHWSGVQCVPGPVRVALTVTQGRVTRLRTQVGGGWPTAESRAMELGDVEPGEASAFFFSLVPQLERSGGDRDRLLLPAVLADDSTAITALLALARDPSRTERTRRDAIQWVGLLGGADVAPALVAFARTGGAVLVDDDPDDDSISSAAIAALSLLEGDVGIPALIELARTGSSRTRHTAVFWLGQNGDPRALRALHDVIADAREERRIRSHAIFSLGQAPTSSTAELVAIYRDTAEDALREQAIFALSQRRDEAATEALLRIAREDGDTRMRGRALFWLAQKHDPRVTKLISDLLVK